VLLAGVPLSNRALIGWFARMRGPGCAVRVIPMYYWYYVLSGVAVGIGTLRHMMSRRNQRRTAGDDAVLHADGGPR
jgi:hypothetical protein